MPPKRSWHQVAEAARARVGVKLGAGVDSAKVCAAIDALIALGDADAVSGNCRTACSKGCSYCCHMRAVVTAPEDPAHRCLHRGNVLGRRASGARPAGRSYRRTGARHGATRHGVRRACPVRCWLLRVQRLSGAPARLPCLQFSLGGRLPGRVRESMRTGTFRSMPNISRSIRAFRRGYCRRWPEAEAPSSLLELTVALVVRCSRIPECSCAVVRRRERLLPLPSSP